MDTEIKCGVAVLGPIEHDPIRVRKPRRITIGRAISQQPGKPSGCWPKLLFSKKNWLGNLDSNQDKQSQSLLCYRYTIPHRSC
jgi:hypothetical protein